MLRKLKFMMAIVISFVLLVSPALTQTIAHAGDPVEPLAEQAGQITPTISAPVIPIEPSIQFAPMSVTYASDLTSFLQFVTIEDPSAAAGQQMIYDSAQTVPGASPTLNTGTTYRLTIKFSEIVGGNQLEYNPAGWLTYQLPLGIKPSAAIVSQPLTSDTNANVGEFSIDASGLLQVQCNNVKIDGSATPAGENFIDFYNDASLKVIASIHVERTGGSQTIDFGGGLAVTVTVMETANASLVVTKTAGDFNPVTQTIAYKVVMSVPADSSSVEHINFTDDSYLHLKHLQDDSHATPHIILDGVLKLTMPGAAVSNPALGGAQMITGVPGGGANMTQYKRFSVPLDITLLPGESATLEYSLKVDSNIFDESVGYNWRLGGLQIAEDAYPKGLINTATATGKDSQGLDVTASASRTTPVELNTLTKSGVLNESANTAAWSVTIGDDSRGWDYRNTKIKDWLTAQSNEMFVQGTNLVIKYIGNGSVLQTITVPVGTNQDGVEWITDPVTVQNGFSFTVQYGSKVTGVTYTVTSDVTGSFNNYANNYVYLYDLSAGENLVGTCSAFVNVGHIKSNPDIRNYVNVLDDGGNTFLEYTIVAKVPGILHGEQVYIDNSLAFVDTRTDMWYPIALNPQNVDVRLFTQTGVGNDIRLLHMQPNMGGTPISYEGSKWQLESTNVNKFNLVFGSPADSRWNGSQNDSILAFAWRVPLSSAVLQGGAPAAPLIATIGDALTSGYGDVRLDCHIRYVNSGQSGYAHTFTISRPRLQLLGVYKETESEYDCAFSFTSEYDLALNPPKEPIITQRYDASLQFKGESAGTSISLPAQVSGTDLSRIITGHPNLPYMTFTLSNNDWYVPMVDGSTNKTIATVSGDSFSVDFSKLKYGYRRIGSSNDWALLELNPNFNSGWFHEITVDRDLMDFRYQLESKLPAGGELSAAPIPHSAEVLFRRGFNIGDGVVLHEGTVRVSGELKANGVLSKTLAASGAKASFEIVVNPTGASITDGQSPVITVNDAMNDKLALYLSTLKVYAKESGIEVDKTGILSQGTLGDETAYTYVFDSAANRLVFYLPDSVPLRITYECQILGAIGDKVDIENTIDINGNYSTTTEQEITLSSATGGVGGSRVDITLMKTDALDPTMRLSGARFAVYGPVNDFFTAPFGLQQTISFSGATFYYYDSATTDANGILSLANSHFVPNCGLLFALVEIEAPVTYWLDGEPILFSLGTPVPANFPSGLTAGAADAAIPITDNITVSNESSIGALPSTGGIGTPLFIMTGFFLLLISGFFLMRKYAFK